ncbi:MAG TPA: efflux RND transporter periplasmic adaptor subunit [Janthinobacterium sp.]|nr:efflux RND transporter periplasmic adaptor subunit [Janthinobacterium sp.]
MHSQKKHRQLTFAASTLAVLALSACGESKQAAPAPKPPEVSVLTVRHAKVPMTIELPGRTSAYLMAQVRARVDGIVQKRSYQEGADVKANQELYQIDPAPYRAALASAAATLQKNEATLATNKAQLERYKVLVGSNAVSKQAYDNAVAAQGQAAADVAAARAAVTVARINLGYTSVVSPISGLSAISLVTQGAYVQASAATLLTTVQQIDPIYVDVRQSSAEGLQLRRQLASGQLKLSGAGQAKVGLLLEDGSEYPLTGTLQYNGVTVDQATGSVTLRALFPNPKHVLLPGMFVRARVDQGTRENAMLVPAQGVSRNRQGEATVLVVGADSKVQQKIIKVGNMIGNNWVVDSGLDEGEKVVVNGSLKIQTGMAVRTVEAPPQGPRLAATDMPAAPDTAPAPKNRDAVPSAAK